jgi:hypothetical protein
VWGNIATFRTTKSILATLHEPFGLDGYLDRFPTIIKDAMTLVQRFHQKFLWIDAVSDILKIYCMQGKDVLTLLRCIVQDDPSDVERQLSLMGDIYSYTYFTIVAVGTQHANCSLPGVMPGSRSSPGLVNIIEGRPFVCLPTFKWSDADSAKSVYETRCLDISRRVSLSSAALRT